MLVLELKPEEIHEDRDFPEQSLSYVHEHLKWFLERQPQLPAVHVRVNDSGRITVLRGHRYLRVARELGRRVIRAIVDKESAAHSVARLSEVRRIVPSSEWDEPSSRGLSHTWHAFFFEPPLNEEIANQFRRVIEDCFDASQSSAIAAAGGAEIRTFDIDLAKGRFAFEAETPWADDTWLSKFLAQCRKFSERAAIVSYQGSRWSKS